MSVPGWSPFLSKIKLALTGAGVIGKRHLRALKSIDNIQLVGIADPFEAARETADAWRVPLFSSTDALLDALDVDGIIVATPTEQHCQPTGQWNVRKPADYYAADWRKRWQAGPILTNLIHEMDLLRYIAGDIGSISAETANSVLGFEKEDTAAIVMRFANDALGTFMLSDQSHSPWSWEQATGENVAFPRSGKNVMHFMGTEGSLEFPNLRLWTSNADESCWTTELAATDLGGELEDAYINQLQHFAAVINGDEKPRIDAQDATDTLRATLAVYEAAETGQRVVL